MNSNITDNTDITDTKDTEIITLGGWKFLSFKNKLRNPFSSRLTRVRKINRLVEEESVCGFFIFNPEIRNRIIQLTQAEYDSLENYKNVIKCSVDIKDGLVTDVIPCRDKDHTCDPSDTTDVSDQEKEQEVSLYKCVWFHHSDRTKFYAVFTVDRPSLLRIQEKSVVKRVNNVSFRDKFFPHIAIKKPIDVKNHSEFLVYVVKRNLSKVYENLKGLPDTYVDKAGRRRVFFPIPSTATIRRYADNFNVFISNFCNLSKVCFPESYEAFFEMFQSLFFSHGTESIFKEAVFSCFVNSNSPDSFYSTKSVRKRVDSILFFIRYSIVHNYQKLVVGTADESNINAVVLSQLSAAGLSEKSYQNLLELHKTARTEEYNEINISVSSLDGMSVTVNQKRIHIQDIINIFKKTLGNLDFLEKFIKSEFNIFMTNEEIRYAYKTNRGERDEVKWSHIPEKSSIHKEHAKLKTAIDNFGKGLLVAMYFSVPYPPRFASLVNTLIQTKPNFYWKSKTRILLRLFYNRKTNSNQLVNYYLPEVLTKKILFFLLKLRPVYIELLGHFTKAKSFDELDSLVSINVDIDMGNDFIMNEFSDDVIIEDENSISKNDYKPSLMISDFSFSYFFKSGSSFKMSVFSADHFVSYIQSLAVTDKKYGIRFLRQSIPSLAIAVAQKYMNPSLLATLLEDDLQRALQHTLKTAQQFYGRSSDGVTSVTGIQRLFELCNIWQMVVGGDKSLNTNEVIKEPHYEVATQNFIEDFEAFLHEKDHIKMNHFQTEIATIFLSSRSRSIGLLLPTGLGKTFLVVNFFRFLLSRDADFSALIIVPFNSIKDELLKAYEGIIRPFGVDSADHPITVVNASSIDERFLDCGNSFSYVFVDECHVLKPGTYRNFDVQQFNSIVYKKAKRLIYSSATLFEDINCWPMKIPVSKTAQIENPCFDASNRVINMNHLFKPSFKIVDTVIDSNYQLADIVVNLATEEKKAVIICNSKNDIAEFKNMFRMVNGVCYISNSEKDGSVEASRIIVGTSIISTGVNIGKLFYVFVWKDYGILHVIQSVGRLRNGGYGIVISKSSQEVTCSACDINRKYKVVDDRCTHDAKLFDKLLVGTTKIHDYDDSDDDESIEIIDVDELSSDDYVSDKKDVADCSNKFIIQRHSSKAVYSNDDTYIIDSDTSNSSISSSKRNLLLDSNDRISDETCPKRYKPTGSWDISDFYLNSETSITCSTQLENVHTSSSSSFNYLLDKKVYHSFLDQMRKVSYIFRDLELIKSILTEQSKCFSIFSNDGEALELFVVSYLNECLLGNEVFGNFWDRWETLDNHYVNESINKLLRQINFKKSKFSAYSRLLEEKLSTKMKSNVVKNTSDKLVAKLMDKFKTINWANFGLEGIKYESKQNPIYNKGIGENRIHFALWKMMKQSMDIECAHFEYTYQSKQYLFAIPSNVRICYKCFRFCCRRKSQCPFSNKYSVLYFLYAIFSKWNKYIGAATDYIVGDIHSFADWINFLARESSIKGVCNYHIWLLYMGISKEQKAIIGYEEYDD